MAISHGFLSPREGCCAFMLRSRINKTNIQEKMSISDPKIIVNITLYIWHYLSLRTDKNSFIERNNNPRVVTPLKTAKGNTIVHLLCVSY